MIETWSMPVPRLTGRQPRKVYVYVPDGDWPEEERFPVLYMFDGHNVFFDEDATYGKSWGMLEYMEETHTPMMIVAVDCNHRPHNGRLSEYSPFTFVDPDFGKVPGRGKWFMDWLVGDLKPVIDSRYPTIPFREATYIAGSSMGGLMALYAVTRYNQYFSKAAALSPSVWLCRGRMPDLIRRTEYMMPTTVYMDYGSREMGNHMGMLREFMHVSNALMEKHLWVETRIVPNGDHCEACWEEQIPFLMRTLTYERE